MFTFHLEAVADPQQLEQSTADAAVVEMCEAVRAAGMKAGIAIKPQTPAELLLPYLQQGLLDLVSQPVCSVSPSSLLLQPPQPGALLQQTLQIIKLSQLLSAM